MISSEVQRTLVKSPPELWAELSDPAALARHLGELGEIRITRTEPEQLVEWEAENRTGTVQIKPSGWGTKVTLTVATEVPDASTAEESATFEATGPAAFAEDESTSFASTDTAEDEAAAFAENEPTAFAEGESAAFAGSEPDALADDEPAAFVEDEPAAFVGSERDALADDEPSPAEEEPAAPGQSIPSRLGTPLTAAAASSWRADTEPADAEDQSPGWIAENAHEPSPEEEAEEEDGEAYAEEEDGEAYEWMSYDEREPRRGFLSRLFGRWRRPPAVEAGAGEDSRAAASGAQGSAAEDSGAAAPAADAVAEATNSAAEAVPECEPPAREDLPHGGSSPVEEALSFEANTHGAEEALSPEANPHGAEEALSPETGAAADPAAAPATPEAPIEMTPSEAASADELEPVQAAVAPVADGATAEPEAISPGTSPAEQVGDIGAELKAAEETEDAEVTAVLTSVLDRLGAAHHRPFSR